MSGLDEGSTAVEISLFNRVTYDGCADLLALLAYPNNKKRKSQFARALRWALVQEKANRYPDWCADIPASQYVPRPYEDLKKICDAGSRQLESRLTAAKIGGVYLQEAMATQLGKRSRLSGGDSISLQEIFSRLEEQPGEPKRRQQATIWKQCLPVIHLAIAFDSHYVQRATKRKNELTASWEATLSIDPALLVAEADIYRRMLVRNRTSQNLRGIGARPMFSEAILLKIIAI